MRSEFDANQQMIEAIVAARAKKLRSGVYKKHHVMLKRSRVSAYLVLAVAIALSIIGMIVIRQ